MSTLVAELKPRNMQYYMITSKMPIWGYPADIAMEQLNLLSHPSPAEVSLLLPPCTLR
eukprot:TRINITY_DN27_c0_g1_i1.p4 TRINITY_DN27_c0_g1~~TRINITY_DN27_c0_g1_i1.p4  ORF type:complete len:58 (-),score=8.07 TRINITY_DN27_c0_g1_i1:5-178(-)